MLVVPGPVVSVLPACYIDAILVALVAIAVVQLQQLQPTLVSTSGSLPLDFGVLTAGLQPFPAIISLSLP